ncbi:hypothetical protein GRI97_15150 [Altererythrobacter xixiisoli]|uniref:Regulatory protein RecX n=1 Tax=Croceibacterium xixiisoli TaxID=1476466 RepID=A0A6I4U046_9SPHN|nr:RecX family transcriptional regulator [Croceibacterium xixiisoli]MXP00328.1 hypothetical protein [Croceibacterium xixiisoli]
MESDPSPSGRTRRTIRPLNSTRLEELAIAYVARFATSSAKLERYLARKIRERGWDGEEDANLPALVARYVGLGYVDDAGFARARSGSLLRRGYGPRRISQALNEAGIAAEIRQDVSPDETARRRAAVALARRRRLGPFAGGAGGAADPALRDKQLAAMLRAGHSMDHARAILALPDVDAAERWAAEWEDDDG